MLPPGDLRMALAALCGESEWGQTWRDVLQHRFAGDGPLGGHALGNLLIVALWELLDDPVAGLDLVARLLEAQGRVLPMAAVPLTIEADVSGLDPTDPDAVRVVSGQAAGRASRPARSTRCGWCRPTRRPTRRRWRPSAGRLGGARPGLVVHLGDAAPARARAAPRPSASPGPDGCSCSTSTPARARRPASVRGVSSRPSSRWRPRPAARRGARRPGGRRRRNRSGATCLRLGAELVVTARGPPRRPGEHDPLRCAAALRDVLATPRPPR